jgi:hypothetical protein
MRFIYAFTILCFISLSLNPERAYAVERDFQFKKEPQIQQIRPPKPVKIKLHRNNKGEYSWDITGDSVDEIIKADKRLRRLLKTE